MLKTLKNAFKVKELRIKIFITLALLLVYRFGCWLPIPGINSDNFSNQVTGDFLTLLSSLSGGALAHGAFLALGVGPYISASIVVQLLSFVIPSLQKLSKSGEDGRKKINQITKFAGLILATMQAIAIVVGFSNNSALNLTLFGAETPAWIVATFIVIMLVAGAMFTFWLGEKITEIGVGNGLSLLIFVGILSTAGTSLGSVVKTIMDGNVSKIWELLVFVLTLIVIFAVIVFMDLAERKVPVQYAKQIKGRKMYGGQSTYIPVKVLGTGVMPIIFATAFITFPQMIASIFWPTSAFYAWYAEWLGAGSYVYAIVVGLLILFFAYFWNSMVFNPEDISRQIQQNGGFVTGIRAGKPTADYLRKVSNRITIFGAIFLAVLAIVPSVVFKAIGGSSLTNAFTATGLIIIVSVALEIEKQLDQQIIMRNYRGFLNKR